MTRLFYIFWILAGIPAFCQQSKTAGKEAPQDTAQVRVLMALGDKADEDEKLAYYGKALALARTLAFGKGILESALKIADNKKKTLPVDSAIAVYKKVMPALQGDKTLLAKLYLNLGDSYEKKSAYDSARYFVNTALKLARTTGDNSSLARGYVVLGNFTLNKYDYDSAFIYYARADSICDHDPALKVSRQHAQVYNYLGYAVRVTHGYDKTKEFYDKSKAMYQALNDEAGIQEINVALAQHYVTREDYAAALPLLNEAVAYHEQYNPALNSHTYAVIVRGYLFVKMKRFADAEKDYQNYYDLAFAGKDRTLQRRATYYMGYFLQQKKDYKTAVEYYTRTIALCKTDNDTRNLKNAYEGLIGVYTETGNLEKLSDTYEEYIALRNELEQKERERAIFELETRYQTEKKEQEIALLTERNNVAEQQSKNQRNLLLSLLVLALLAGAFLYFSYRNKIKTANKLKELDELKSRFFSNISHEFRTPLTLIKSPLQRLQATDTSEENRKHLATIDQSANRMLDLVDQLLELSRLDSGKLKLVLKKVNVPSFLHSLAEPFAFEATTRRIQWQQDIAPAPEAYWLDKDVTEKIVGNLLTNALKYTPGGHRIFFSAQVSNGRLQLSVANDGVNVAPGDVGRLFERFYQQKETEQGVGIGLALVKELVSLYRGTIATHTENNTLTFVIALPLDRELLKDVSIVAEEETGGAIPAAGERDDEAQELPILLIADDNADIRLILNDIFRKEYRILEAANGEDALAIAQKEVPDVIVSDIMMPLVNGYDLARHIKQNEITSSIPVVLLTARAGDEAHLASLQNQADAFITKPFNHEILKLKVRSLLDERKKLRERYSRELVLKPREITINSVDEKFIDRLQTILDAHLADPDFSADDFAREAGMSRMQLHRKLKSLLGVSATEFLRNERLNTALDLLKKPNVTISEVAYSVGFNDADYFSRCFKDKYGTTPSVFLKENGGN